ncbi:hypothetical protein BU26DRAFT_562387 [Trematosphaeria pertusa]|uniref:C2H2-type domain-containing protein n=1 Tax=Trematosphaeria pertusa TaxID=390896 RepID=A0A6A6IQ41_9PLEO|nr:uncharacterized protein BU26DRAFT_562387 [Trematosphaeria pertusa]KAF2252664.1 hypothetical protein BU26DRAFT_562387 [Trematosphaeria pertusa]
MTPRSPKPQPKTTTISRRLRIRADQNLSVQPPEVRQLRTIRSRRAAILPTNRRTSVNYQTEETHTPVWHPDVLDSFTRSNTSHPAGIEQNPDCDLLLSEPLDLQSYHSPRGSPSAPDPETYEVQTTSESELLPSPLPSLSGSHTATDYDLRLSAEPEPLQDPTLELQDMSTLGFMMAPAQYNMDYVSPPPLDSPSYPPISQSYSDTKASSSASYAPAYASSPNLQGHSHSRRSTEHPVLPPYQAPSMPRSPYQQALGPMRASPSPMSYPPTSSEPSPMLSSAPHSYPYPAVHANLPGQTLGSNSSSYPPPPIYPPTSYGISEYSPLPTTLYPATTSAPPYASYEQSSTLAPPSAGSVPGLSSSPGSQTNGMMPRVLNSRPKPQCWEHGCNGRQFSTFSNLLRHQREKSGTAAKSYCPRCGAEFTRTTARNGHMAHEKCKPRRTSDTTR